MKATGSQRLMEFHQPFLTDVSHRFPRADILLGKPFPIAAAARFYDGGKSGRSGAKVHWLVDSADRLRQYAEFAAQTDRRMSIALEIDVGFHRGGFATPQEAALALTAIKADPRLTFAGFMGYDVHISIFAQTLGPMEASRDRTRAAYEGFLSAARSVDPAFADPAKLIVNTGGSTTYPLYRAGRAVTPCNDLALGSGLLKPTFCDRTLPNHIPAVFIATPVLKVLDGVRVPGLETDPRGGANDALERTKTVFCMVENGWLMRFGPRRCRRIQSMGARATRTCSLRHRMSRSRLMIWRSSGRPRPKGFFCSLARSPFLAMDASSTAGSC